MQKFPSKIFLDGGLPEETKKANEILLEKFGRPLDGQTTNPTLIAKNLKARMEDTKAPKHPRGSPTSSAEALTSPGEGRMDSSGVKEPVKPKDTPGVTRQLAGSPGVEESAKPFRLTPELALEEYKRIVQEMSSIIPQGSISIQVFANQETKSEEMLAQARERSRWIPNASIKLPCNPKGLKAAEIVCREFPINITLVFSQSQAAAVYEATKKAKYPVFISPFVGRLDDRGECGMDVVANILRMFKEHAEGHERNRMTAGPESLDAVYSERSRTARDKLRRRVEVLTASVRNLGHIFRAFSLKSNIITIPFKVFKEWADTGFIKAPKIPQEWAKRLNHPRGSPTCPPKPRRRRKGFPWGEGISKPLSPIPYQQHITLGKPWQSYDLHHDLTDIGIDLFFSDWNSLFST